MRSEYRWVATVFLVPACFTVLMLFVPIPTSLGDGTDENVLTGWQAFFDRFSHRSFADFGLKAVITTMSVQTPFSAAGFRFTIRASFSPRR